MQAIQVWSVIRDGGAVQAHPLEEVSSAEQEALLEDILVASPDLLLPGVTLVGRQVPTDGGPLDLIGVDREGKLVVFELKRGTLTREAVAQVVDYVSDLATRSAEDVAHLLERHSGGRGIDPIPDFMDWYGREYPDVPEFEPNEARMILVGLGVDDRARRVVSYLAERGIDIQLLTFHGFRQGGHLFLARQVETKSPVRVGSTQALTKEGSRIRLHALAREMEALELLEDVADLVGARMPSAYRWPGKTAYSFSLQELTSEGRPTLRSYVTLYVHQKRKGCVSLTFSPSAFAVAPAAFSSALGVIEGAFDPEQRTIPFQVDISSDSWGRQRAPVENLLDEVVQGWAAKREAEEDEADSEVLAASDG